MKLAVTDPEAVCGGAQREPSEPDDAPLIIALDVGPVGQALAPAGLVLAVAGGTYPLEPAEVASWQAVEGSGTAILAPSVARGDVRYLGRFVVSPDAEGPQATLVTFARRGGRTIMALRPSEPSRLVGCLEPVSSSLRASVLYRTMETSLLGAGARSVWLPRLPDGRYRLRLLVRDRAGNSTPLRRVFNVSE